MNFAGIGSSPRNPCADVINPNACASNKPSSESLTLNRRPCLKAEDSSNCQDNHAKCFIEISLHGFPSAQPRGARPSQGRRLHDGEESQESREAEGEWPKSGVIGKCAFVHENFLFLFLPFVQNMVHYSASLFGDSNYYINLLLL